MIQWSNKAPDWVKTLAALRILRTYLRHAEGHKARSLKASFLHYMWNGRLTFNAYQQWLSGFCWDESGLTLGWGCSGDFGSGAKLLHSKVNLKMSFFLKVVDLSLKFDINYWMRPPSAWVLEFMFMFMWFYILSIYLNCFCHLNRFSQISGSVWVFLSSRM